MLLCLFEDPRVDALRPLVETRAAYDLRVGPRTLLETSRDAFDPEKLLLHARPLVAETTALHHEDALVNTLPNGADVLFVNGRFLAEEGPARAQIGRSAQTDEARAFIQEDALVAAWLPDAAAHLPEDALTRPSLSADAFANLPATPLEEATLVGRPWHLLDVLRPALKRGIAACTEELPQRQSLHDRPHATVHESVVSVRDEEIHLGAGATIRPGAILNASDGPIYIDREAVVFEQAVIRGPCYVGPRSQVKIGANLEGTAAGTWCKLGGEVHDCILQSYANKSHAGFLGHSYLGRWCNLGADTNTSNLKNDYGEVTVFAPEDDAFLSTGRQFAGLFMGDHSKCGINTMFNTGTVVGTCCNLYGGGFPPRYVPPFSWGGPTAGLTEYRLGKALEVAERVMARRDTPFTEADQSLLAGLFRRTQDEREAHHG